MLFRCGTDGEGKEERPIGNSIKNTSRTGAEAERKKVVLIIWVSFLLFVDNLLVVRSVFRVSVYKDMSQLFIHSRLIITFPLRLHVTCIFYDIIQNTDFSCIIIKMLLTVPLYMLCSPDFRHVTGWSLGWRRRRLKQRPLCVHLCARQFSHHGNLLSHKKNKKTQFLLSHTRTHTQVWGNERPASCSFSCFCVRDKALFYVEKGWGCERGLCQSLEIKTAAFMLLCYLSSVRVAHKKKGAFL